MLAVEKWAQGKPFVIPPCAQHLASLVEVFYEEFTLKPLW